MSKPHSFTRSKFIALLMLWSAGFLSCVSDIVSGSREVDKFSLFEYANLSHVLEDTMIEGHHALMKMKN
ncbi:hypothetical protein V6N13_114934 [Hibiscus sabdariffa]|uniref:Uncharacterized protein n=2 Tax=Hibiscus sabdariffa TaxID=183260 RepID=A0ABR2U3L9_9ROSI